MVYVLNQDRKPLMPCTPAIARLLLKEGKAKVKSRVPFTIKLTYKTAAFELMDSEMEREYPERSQSLTDILKLT